ncbi:nucleotide exchange factor GrpE [Staphylococcus pseudintermedius]|uniref:nucleotide exchange factor GrpE n=1 Tax=Staphylococcus pseudintermedius TaxID=283734 RepID=UPI000C1C7BE1|nr:nucleotide exchange factor GrpE [Staphylococcus pseudintermedius]EGQ2916164.1 nucleotide exchange factor GrpE [Staphylococcus pseudintermedius]EGQ2975246.1 nucleotide exchange factor GrpE [Staphylococcus pseudintermedius]EGQ3277419.1 nucleotide exchange factor GrpE [Staphylococcus pseudintermedius]EGQ3647751.1 nucleotide exchange factor GrpE [Staphylococcus pseudintermedius]EGQ3846769.1 nucleotide exchange factor GrpE [Staphylococcus pseudintermedius]
MFKRNGGLKMSEEKDVRKDEEIKETESQETTETSELEVENEQVAVNQDSENENDASYDETQDLKDEEIASLKAEVDAKEEQYLRLYAEFENYKRRIQNEAQTQKRYQAQKVLTDVLPALDNFERALKIEGDDESFNALKKGVEMVYESLLKALEDNGLEKIKTEGEQFDPNFHQAVMQDENPDFESGQITEELQAGYQLKDRVLRASMVKVNQ